MTAPAIYIGLQPGFGQMPAFELYTLQDQVGEHPAGSTVSRQTLENHGFSMGARRLARKGRRWLKQKAA
jgi:hypothetical protein